MVLYAIPRRTLNPFASFQKYLSKNVTLKYISKFPFTIISLFMVTLILTNSIIPSLLYAQQPVNNNVANNPIKHIVIIMQENRSFDNYFGTYAGANGIPKNVCIPLDPKQANHGCVKPFLTTNPITVRDIPH